MSGTPTQAASGNIRIDRLVLQLPSLDAASAGRLAELVATHLVRDGRAASDVSVPRLAVVLDAPDTDLDDIARRIARAVLQQAW